jgi:hypothetical protein
MIGNALRYEIEGYAARIRTESPVFRGAVEGALTPRCVERYLSSLRYMVASSPPCLQRAAARARALGHEELAIFFADKAVEESGHDEWAEHDLYVLRSRFHLGGDDAPVPSIVALMRFCEDTIDRNPVLYLAYVLWTEYMTTLLGSEFVSTLVQRCGVPRNAMTCLDKHAELDPEHAADDLEVIDTLVADPSMLAPLREFLHRSMMLFDRGCEEMVDPMPARVAS